jgi:hypothetical protein
MKSDTKTILLENSTFIYCILKRILNNSKSLLLKNILYKFNETQI